MGLLADRPLSGRVQNRQGLKWGGMQTSRTTPPELLGNLSISLNLNHRAVPTMEANLKRLARSVHFPCLGILPRFPDSREAARAQLLLVATALPPPTREPEDNRARVDRSGETSQRLWLHKDFWQEDQGRSLFPYGKSKLRAVGPMVVGKLAALRANGN